MYTLWLTAAVAASVGSLNGPMVPPGQSDARIDLNSDRRLLAPVDLVGQYESLGSSLKRLASNAHVNLSVADDVAGRRLSFRLKGVPLHAAMSSIARVMHLEWRVKQSQVAAVVVRDGVYELYRTEEQKSRETSLEQTAERRENAINKAVRDMVLSIMSEALAERDPDRPSIADLLKGLSADDVNVIADAAVSPVSTIAADNQGHFHEHLALATPFRDLSPDGQRSVRAMVGRPEFGGGGAAPAFVPAFDSPDDLNVSDIGVVAFEGGVRLAVVGPDGKDVWVSPTDGIMPRPIPGVSMDDETDPLYVVPRGPSLSTMPNVVRNTKIRIGAGVRRRLGDLLSTIAEQADVSFVSDDFLRTRCTPYHWVFTDRPEYSLVQTLDQFSLTFDHNIAWRNRIVEVETAARGADLRADPPARLYSRLAMLTARRQALELDDYLNLGALSRTQLRALMLSKPFDDRLNSAALRVERAYRPFHLFATLTPAERKKAEAPEGLLETELSATQAVELKRVARIGLPARGPFVERAPVARFAAKPNPGSNTSIPSSMTFMCAAGGDKTRATAWSISFH